MNKNKNIKNNQINNDNKKTTTHHYIFTDFTTDLMKVHFLK